MNDEKRAVVGANDQVGVGPRVATTNLMLKIGKDAKWLPRRLASASRGTATPGTPGSTTATTAAALATPIQPGRNVAAQHRLQLQGLAQLDKGVL